TPQGVEQQVVRRHGFVGEPLFGPHEGGGTDLQIIVGGEEITDLTIRHAEPMFEFGAHGEDDVTKGVAGDANGIGGLFGMTPLEVAVATAAIAGLDVELRDDGYDRRQVGLKLGDRVTVIQRRRTSGVLAERHVDDTIRLGRGTHCGGMARLSTRFLTAFLQVATAKAIGLTRLLPGGRLQIPPQASVLGFQLGQACLELLDQGVTLTTARTHRRGSGHNKSQAVPWGIAMSWCSAEVHFHNTRGGKGKTDKNWTKAKLTVNGYAGVSPIVLDIANVAVKTLEVASVRHYRLIEDLAPCSSD